MAAISITVSETTGLFSISIDWNGWETFSVIDGDSSSKTVLISRTQITTYPQHESQMIAFYLSLAPDAVEVVNQGQIMVLDGDSSNYMCAIVYAGDGTFASPFTLTGFCQQVGKNFTSTGASVSFTQTGMTGNFSTTP